MVKTAPDMNGTGAWLGHSAGSAERTIAGRQAILAAAEALFAAKGYQSVSIDNIAGAARVSRGLVHYHFHSKEELFIDLVRDVMEEFSRKLSQDMAKSCTAREKIRALLLAYLNLAETRRNLWRTGVSEASGLSEAIGRMLASYRRENLAIITGVLDKGVAEGELKPGDTQFVAHCMMAIITGAALGRFVSEVGLSAETIAENIADFLLDGIAR